MSSKNGKNGSFYKNGTYGASGASNEFNLNLNLTPSSENAKYKDLDLSKYDLICFSHLRWDFVFQRPQHLLTRCAKTQRVFYIEEPVFGEVEQDHFKSKPTPEGVTVITPFLKHGYGEEEVNGKLKYLLEELFELRTIKSYIFWYYTPMPIAYSTFFEPTLIIYDCMDELANFRFAPPDITEREQYLMARADIVYTGGYQLYEAKSGHHPNVFFHGCGVDAGHFGRARLASTVVPEAVAALPGPVFGYIGVIDERLDYALIEALARDFPDASVVMAGPLAKVSADELPRSPNIHWLGQQPYEALPALVKGFDVCLMPFALNEATRCINPTKTLEYMAAGKPIVSTAVPDVVRHFTPVVSVAADHEEFLDAAARAACAPDPVLLRKGIAQAMEASWDSIVATMRAELLAAVLPVRDGAAAAR